MIASIVSLAIQNLICTQCPVTITVSSTEAAALLFEVANDDNGEQSDSTQIRLVGCITHQDTNQKHSADRTDFSVTWDLSLLHWTNNRFLSP
jgi:hypothetical protein